MHLVIDSNCLRKPELDRFLSRSRSNYAVITDYASMEAYKGNALINIQKSMEILARHSGQVVILKGTMTVCGLNTRSSGLRNRLVDAHATGHFPRFCRDLAAAGRGAEIFKKSILDHGQAATEQLERIRRDATNYAEALASVVKQYDPEELSIIRKRSGYTVAMIDKILKHIFAIYELASRIHPRAKSLPDPETLRNSFIFRISICHYLLGLDWIRNGGIDAAPADRLRNDMVDVNFAAYATYFDGLMSADDKAKRIYGEARFLLETLFTKEFFEDRPLPN